jgi:hypothetical protein
MGLGPALCIEHQVLAEHNTDIYSREWSWRCPVCHTTKLGNTGLGDIPWKLYEDNMKFWKFVDGKDPTV